MYNYLLKVFMQIACRVVALAVAIVVIFVLGACSGRDINREAVDGERSPVPESNEESDTVDASEPEASTEEPAEPPSVEPTVSPPAETSEVLSVEEAREIAQVWLDEHPVHEPNLLDEEEHEDVEHDGNSYYRFYHIEPMLYWFSILVNIESGELLVMLTEDGMEPGPPVIEPLDDWYYRTFED